MNYFNGLLTISFSHIFLQVGVFLFDNLAFISLYWTKSFYVFSINITLGSLCFYNEIKKFNHTILGIVQGPIDKINLPDDKFSVYFQSRSLLKKIWLIKIKNQDYNVYAQVFF